MFGAVAITFTITVLSMLVLYQWEKSKRQVNENGQLHRENDLLNKQMHEFREQDHFRRETEAYHHGLYDGRQTDTLYRKMLNRYQRGEQATVMLTGTEPSNRKH